MSEDTERKIDPEFLSKLRDFTREIQWIVGNFYDEAILSNNPDLFSMRQKLNADLTAALERHNREIDWRMGKPIKPQIHFAEATIQGRGGMG